MGGGVQQQVDALEGLNAAHIEQHLVAVEAQFAAGLGAAQGAETGQVNAARNQLNAGGVGAVQPGHGVAFVGAEGDDAVGGGDDCRLGTLPDVRLAFTGAGLHFDAGQGVESDQMRGAEGGGEIPSGQAA